MDTVEDAKTKRKSSLMMHIFPEGSMLPPVPAQSLTLPDFVADDLPSYVNPGFTPAWTSAEAEQSDFSRIVRLARKLPDKLETFFKEMNKLRLHALSTCDFQFLDILYDILRQEQLALTNPLGASELDLVLQRLRPTENVDVVIPLISTDGREFSLLG